MSVGVRCLVIAISATLLCAPDAESQQPRFIPSAPEVVIVERPMTGQVNAVFLDSWGETLLLGYVTGELRSLSVANGTVGPNRRLHVAPITSISRGGRMTLYTAEDGSVLLEGVEGWQEPVRYIGHLNATWGALSANGRVMVTASRDSTIRVWNVNFLREYGRLSEGVRQWSALAVSPNGEMIAAGASDGTIQLWSRLTWQSIATHRLRGSITALKFTPSGTALVAGTADRAVVVFDAHRLDVRWRRAAPGTVRDVAISGDGQWVAAAGGFATVPVWRFETGRTVARPMSVPAGTRRVQFALRDSVIVAVTEDGEVVSSSVRLWNDRRVLTGEERGPSALVASASGDTLWVRRTDAPMTEYTIARRIAFRRAPTDLRLRFPNRIVDRGRVLSGLERSRIERLPNGGFQAQGIRGGIAWSNPFIDVVDASPSGQFMLGFTIPRDTTLSLLAAGTGRAIWRRGFGERIERARFTSDQDVLITFRDGRSILIDRESGRLLRAARFDQSEVAAKQEMRVDISTRGRIRVIDTRRGAVLADEPSPVDHVLFAELSSDNSRVLIEAEGEVWVGDIELSKPTGRSRLVGDVSSIVRHPDAVVRYSASGDGFIDVHNVATGARIARIQAHRAAVTALAISGDGQWLFSGASDGTIVRWRLSQ